MSLTQSRLAAYDAEDSTATFRPDHVAAADEPLTVDGAVVVDAAVDPERFRLRRDADVSRVPACLCGDRVRGAVTFMGDVTKRRFDSEVPHVYIGRNLAFDGDDAHIAHMFNTKPGDDGFLGPHPAAMPPRDADDATRAVYFAEYERAFYALLNRDEAFREAVHDLAGSRLTVFAEYGDLSHAAVVVDYLNAMFAPSGVRR